MMDGLDTSLLFVNGTNTLYAYSELAQPAVGPNAYTSHTINKAPAAAVGVVAGASISSWHGLVKSVYSPVVGITNVAKTPLPAGQASGGETVYSASQALQGSAYSLASYLANDSSFSPDGVAANPVLKATPGYRVTGASAAYANDPMTFSSSGTYSYDPTVDGSISLDDPSQTGAINMFALDSRETDEADWEAAGQPYTETLWELTISANGIPQSKSDVTVNFYLNPQDASLGILSTSYTQSQIEQNVINAITVSDGTVTLPSMSVFDPNAEYFVPTGGAIDYDYGAVGDLAGSTTTIPEPTCLALLSTGVYGALRRRRV